MIMFVAYKNAFAGPSHAMFLVVVLQSPQPSQHGGILLKLDILGTKRVVG